MENSLRSAEFTGFAPDEAHSDLMIDEESEEAAELEEFDQRHETWYAHWAKKIGTVVRDTALTTALFGVMQETVGKYAAEPNEYKHLAALAMMAAAVSWHFPRHVDSMCKLLKIKP